MIRVEGCNCGGWLNHRTDCTLWDLPPEESRKAIDHADARWAEHFAALHDDTGASNERGEDLPDH